MKREENVNVGRNRIARAADEGLQSEYAAAMSAWLSDVPRVLGMHVTDPSLAARESDPSSAAWESDLHSVRPRDWQRLDFPSDNPLVRLEDEVPVFRFKAARLAEEHVADRRILEVVDTYLPDDPQPVDRLSDRPKISSLISSIRPDPVNKFQRRSWLLLLVVSLVWGGLSGAAFSLNTFPITPSAAVAGALGLIVLALTLFRLGRANQ
jgi:hypothetical protein